jgi:hypothetical protein
MAGGIAYKQNIEIRQKDFLRDFQMEKYFVKDSWAFVLEIDDSGKIFQTAIVIVIGSDGFNFKPGPFKGFRKAILDCHHEKVIRDADRNDPENFH